MQYQIILKFYPVNASITLKWGRKPGWEQPSWLTASQVFAGTTKKKNHSEFIFAPQSEVLICCHAASQAPHPGLCLELYTWSESSVIKDTGKRGKSRCEMRAVKRGNKPGRRCWIINEVCRSTPLCGNPRPLRGARRHQTEWWRIHIRFQTTPTDSPKLGSSVCSEGLKETQTVSLFPSHASITFAPDAETRTYRCNYRFRALMFDQQQAPMK